MSIINVNNFVFRKRQRILRISVWEGIDLCNHAHINDTPVGHCLLPRLPYSRLDVSIIAGKGQAVVCQFEDWRVYAPQSTHLYPTLEKFTGLTLA